MSGIISEVSTDFRALGTPLAASAEQSAGRAQPLPFDADLLREIGRIGFHPFILVRIGEDHSSIRQFIVCRTQNDAGRFVQELASLPQFAESKLLRAIERALQLEIYEAADMLFSWTQEPAGPVTETAYVGIPERAPLEVFYNYPAYQLTGTASRGDPDFRTRLLGKMFDAYAIADGNDALRFAVMEALAFGLSRALSHVGRFAEALAIVDRALTSRPYSIHLKAAKHALGLRLTGKTVPPRLENFIGDLLQEINHIGFSPFILVRIGGDDSRTPQFVVCRTQNDAGQFIKEIASLPEFAGSKLLRAIERALQLEIYEAADLLFSWTQEPAGSVTEMAYVGLPPGTALEVFYTYPAYQLTVSASRGDPDFRTRLLEEMFDAYAVADGNDALRFAVMEALAFGLSRVLGHVGKYSEALAIVARALISRPYSIHLKAARHALSLRLEGKKLPPRLEKFIGQDNGHLKQFVCPLPFERFDIGPNGDVLVCCGHWLPTSIGNFMKQPIDDIVNSAAAQKIRASVTDGSYKYCNHLECGAMAQDSLPRRDELRQSRTRDAVAHGNFHLDGVDEVMFAFDQTCNLSCPSCRTHRIVEKVSESLDKARAVEEKLLPLLPTLRILHINPAGELFASKPSRRLLELINDERCPDLVLHIISNGTLFSEEEWNKFPGIHGKVRSVRISIDAACKETFENLRRLGKYDVFVDNMRFLSRLRSTGAIPQLKFSFTYQLGNFREMRAFVDFCERMNADFAIFERLQNIAFTHEEYRRKAVHYPDHPLYAEFIDVIKDPVFRAKRVWHDFDYPDVDKMSSEEVRERLREERARIEARIGTPLAELRRAFKSRGFQWRRGFTRR